MQIRPAAGKPAAGHGGGGGGRDPATAGGAPRNIHDDGGDDGADGQEREEWQAAVRSRPDLVAIVIFTVAVVILIVAVVTFILDGRGLTAYCRGTVKVWPSTATPPSPAHPDRNQTQAAGGPRPDPDRVWQ